MIVPFGQDKTLRLTAIQCFIYLLATFMVFMIVYQTIKYGHPIYHDDAFISLTYARHLARGDGIVFNLGEHVWGFTSPLHVLILGFIGLFVDDLRIPAAILGAVSSGVTSLIFFFLIRRFSSDRVGFLTFLVSLTGSYSFWFLGLETNLLVMTQVAFVLASLVSGPLTIGLLGSLACLFRPDSMLLCIPIIFLNKRVTSWKVFLVFCIPGVLWVLFDLSYYGAWLPQSFYAKKGLADFWQFLMVALPGLDKINHLEQEGHFIFWAIFNFILTLGCLLNERFRAERIIIYAMLLYPWVLIFSYAAIGSPPGHSWEYRSAFVFNWVAVFLGLSNIVICLGNMGARYIVTSQGKILGKSLRNLLEVFVIMFSLVGLSGHLRRISTDQTAYWWGGRHLSYLALSDWMMKNTLPVSRIFYGEPGTVAFFSERFVTDNYLISRVGESEVDYLVLQGDVGYHHSGSAAFHRIDTIKKGGFEELSILKRDVLE